MPAKSKVQQMMMGAELRRKRMGMKGRTDMSETELEKLASVSHKGLPKRTKRSKK